MKFKYGLFLAGMLLFAAGSQAQNTNTTFRSKVTYSGQTLANLWGYWADGKEYALVGASQGMDIVDITDPDNPQEIVQIPGPNSLWKEIKTYGHYAYIVSEGGMGVQVVDLSNLPSPNLAYHSYYGDGLINNQLNKAHALHVDTTKGFLYIYGSNLNNGTALYLDLNQDPYNPTYAGRFPGIGYVHDGYVDNDTMYSCHIYQGEFAIVDVSDKLNPVLLGSQVTPGAFTHNDWLSTDHKTIFSTDEVSNSFLTAYDISDPTDIKYLDKIQSNPGSGVIVHNTEIKGDFAVTSWYRDGFTIVDVSRPDNLVQVGNYDTYDGSGSGFQGCWGVYPFFPSGTIIADNISAPGSSNTGELFVITPQYVHACYLEGSVTNAASGLGLQGATITIIDTANNTETSNALGIFKMGQLHNGHFTVEVSASGFQTYTTEVDLANGQVTNLNVVLFPEGDVSLSGTVIDDADGSLVPGATVRLKGAQQNYTVFSTAGGQFTLNNIKPGYYDISAAAMGHGKMYLAHQTVAANNGNLILAVKKSSQRPGKMRP